MTVFLALATLMIVAAAAFLATPLLRRPRTSPGGIDRSAANLAILGDQLSELEHERDEGSLTDQDFTQAKAELQRRLLDEVKAESPPATSAIAASDARPSRKTAIALIVLLPLIALGGYGLLGNPRALDPEATRPPVRVTAGQIEEMVKKLEDKLKQNPGDSKGWVMLARSYKAMGRFGESAAAYEKAGALVDGDPILLADYAEALAMSGEGFQGKPTELINKALALSPEDPQALLLAGAAAGERRDFKAAVGYWERVLPVLEPGSEEAEALAAAIAQAKSAGDGRQNNPAAKGPAISGTVSLPAKLASRLKPGDALFVFARADGGKGMPLAVIRTTADKLPLDFRLDDSMALPGGEKLSSATRLTIEARITRSGTAETASGDLFGRQGGIKPGTGGIRLVIDKVVP